MCINFYLSILTNQSHENSVKLINNWPDILNSAKFIEYQLVLYFFLLNHILIMMLSYTVFYLMLTTIVLTTESKSVQHNFHSDVIVTQWPTKKAGSASNENEDHPGFVVSNVCIGIIYIKRLKMIKDTSISLNLNSPLFVHFNVHGRLLLDGRSFFHLIKLRLSFWP